jgi:transposase
MARELRPLPDPEQAILKALSTRRRQLTESIASEKTRLKQAFDPLIIESCRETIAILEDKRQAIEVDLDRRIEAEDRVARWRAIPSSIPGVRARISALLVASRCRNRARSTARLPQADYSRRHRDDRARLPGIPPDD